MKTFDDLFDLYNNDVYRLAYSYVLNKCDAEDITQKTFYKLYINIKKVSLINSNEDIKKWLFRITINEAKNHLKSSWFKTIKNQEDDNLGICTNKSELNEFTCALKNISSQYRIVLYLHYLEGYNIKEISKIIKKSESAVKMRLMRGKEELRKEMEVQNERL